MESRLPYVRALIDQLGMEAFVELEVEMVRRQPVPMALVNALGEIHDPLPLTPAQARALALAAEGLTTDEIASVLTLSAHTIKTELKDARDRLGARNTTHGVVLAIRSGELPGLAGPRRPVAA